MTSNIGQPNILGSPPELGSVPNMEPQTSTMKVGDNGSIGAETTSDSRKAESPLKVISSLHPILQFMNIYFDGTEWQYEIDRNTEWDVIPAHTAEVEEITINTGEEAMPPAAYMQIPRSLAGSYLFPNLTQLQLVNRPLRSSLHHLPLFVSPRLHSLEIDNISQDNIPWLDCFLRDPDLQVSLTHVTLGPIQYSPGILRAISNCRSLHSATLIFDGSKPLDHEAVGLLGTTPKLQSLTVKADRVPYVSAPVVHDAVPTGFAALRDICVIGVYSFIASIFANVKADATIHTLNMTISSDWATKGPNPFRPRVRMISLPSPEDRKVEVTLHPRIYTLLSLVAKNWSSSLYDFTLVVDLGTQGMTSSHPTLLPICIDHLAKVSGLRRLVMSGFHLEGLDDFLQTRLWGSLWPNIEEIQFPLLLQDQGMGVRTTISLPTFTRLVWWTKLVSFSGLITLPDNADNLPRTFTESFMQSGLKQLSTGSLEAIEGNHQMIQIARFLEKLCPDLDKLTTHTEFAATTWDNIYEIMTTFKEVRQEERAAVMRSLRA